MALRLSGGDLRLLKLVEGGTAERGGLGKQSGRALRTRCEVRHDSRRIPNVMGESGHTR